MQSVMCRVQCADCNMQKVVRRVSRAKRDARYEAREK